MNTASSIQDPAGHQILQSIAAAPKFNAWMYAQITPYLQGTVLEIGSGIGNISAFVVADGYDITLSDYNPDYCGELRKKFGDKKNVRSVEQIDLQATDFFTRYASLQAGFDTVYLLNVLEHLKDEALAIEACQFLLKPGGRLILLTPAYPFLYAKLDAQLGHYRRYTRKTLAAVVEQQGLQVIACRYFNALGLAGWAVSAKLLRRTTIQEGQMKWFERLMPLARLLDGLVARQIGLSVICVGKKI
jgi:2-polyprenyl-3-methyl-5-hydroxy-6-metoxy-1,4-benzoquinol methylase